MTNLSLRRKYQELLNFTKDWYLKEEKIKKIEERLLPTEQERLFMDLLRVIFDAGWVVQQYSDWKKILSFCGFKCREDLVDHTAIFLKKAAEIFKFTQVLENEVLN